MSDFKAKMHQIRFRLGLRPRPTQLGSLQRSPRPLAGFKGPSSKGMEKRGWQGKGRQRGKVVGWDDKEGDGTAREDKNVLFHVKQAVAAYGVHTWKSEALRVPREESWCNHNRHCPTAIGSGGIGWHLQKDCWLIRKQMLVTLLY